MNGSRAASVTVPWRFPSLRIEGFPWTPAIIICVIALAAIFADALAPYNPEIGVLGDRFPPPARRVGGPGNHAKHGHVAVAAGADLRDLPRGRGGPQHVTSSSSWPPCTGRA